MSLIEMCDCIDLPTGNEILKSLNKQQLQSKKNIEKVIQEKKLNIKSFKNESSKL